MSAESKREQGEKNRKRVEGALGVKPQLVPALASKLKAKESTVLRHLKALVAAGAAVAVKQGRNVAYQKPSAAA